MIDRALDLILKLTGVEDAIAQSELVIQLQKTLKLDPDHPPDNFDGVYVCTLVKYVHNDAGNRRPAALLEFFRHPKIRQFIRLTYDGASVTPALHNEIAELLIGPLGQELSAQGINLAAEMQCFEALFTEVVKRTRKPKEVRQERELAQRFDRIEQQIQQQNSALQAAIDQKLAQLPGGHSAVLPATEIATEFPLVRQVKAWFKALDYGEDSYSQVTEDYCEWIATIPARRGFDRILVRCVKGEASPTDVEELFATVEAQDTDEGWLVYNRRISKTAQTLLEGRQYRRVLFSYTLDDLIDQAADFSNYIEWLEKEVCDRNINTDYVQLACKKDDIDLTTQRKIGTSRYSDTEGGIEGYVNGWLEDDAKEHLSVLGEFGTGKTWFSFHYAWLALQKYQQTKAQRRVRSRLPLVIPLRDYAKALDVENVIANFFFNKHDIRITSKMFAQLNRMGKLLLIFDGFDEMAARVDKQAMINNFWELARVVGPGAKAILTCRTEHFPDAKQGRKLLSAELQASTKNLTGEPPEFEVLELEKFNESQIRTMLSNKTDGTMVETVMSNAKLMELAERPVMVDLILDALPKIESLDDVGELNMSRVYLYAVTRRLEKDWQEKRTFTSMADKLYFLCEVSWEMLQTDQMSLHFTSFPERLQTLFGDKVREQKDLDHWHYDMMGQAMLVRDDEGNYRPAHRSLLEFFAAYKIIASLGVIEEEFLEIARSQSNISKAAKAKNFTWEQYFSRQCHQNSSLVYIPPLNSFNTESFQQLFSLIGENGLTKALVDLASLMLDPLTAKEKILKIIQQTKGKTINEVGYVANNLIQLILRRDYHALENADLCETTLPGVNLANVSLRHTLLRQARLDNPTFTKVLAAVYTIAFSPDGKLLAVGDDSGTVQLWNTENYQVLMLKKVHNSAVMSITFSPDGSTLASGSSDKTIKLWSVQKQCELTTFKGHEQWVWSVAFSPDGSMLASGGSDRTVKLWSIEQQCELATFRGHTNRIRVVTFDLDGNILASAGLDNTIKLWSIKHRREIKTLTEHKDWVFSVVFSPDKTMFASGSNDNTIKLWSVKYKHELATLSGHEKGVRSVSFSPDGKYLASGSTDKTVKLWSVRDMQEIITLKGHENRIRSVNFSPDGSYLASGSDDNTIRLWSVNQTKEVVTLKGYENRVFVMFSSNGDLLASSSDNNSIKLWSISRREEIAVLKGHENKIRSISFSPDWQLLASGSDDSTIRLWSISQREEIAVLKGHKIWVLCVAFSPDGRFLASGSADKTIKIWSVNQAREIRTLRGHGSGVWSINFSPDGSTLASGSSDKTIKLWSINNDKELTTLGNHKDWIFSVSFSPNGQLLASGSSDKTIKIWSIEDQKELFTLLGHQSWVTSVSFSPDGSMLASGSANQNIHLWDTLTGNCLIVFDDRLCAGLDITSAIGLTNAQSTALQLLGAVDGDIPLSTATYKGEDHE